MATPRSTAVRGTSTWASFISAYVLVLDFMEDSFRKEGLPPLTWYDVLWLLDASLNVSMEPFRAFVGDMLRKDQHSAGYAVQTAFIGAGAVVGSIFPWALEHLGVSNTAPGGGIPDTVRYAFWFGGAALFLAVLWTIVSTKEYSPEEMAAFDGPRAEADETAMRALAARSNTSSLIWIAAGAAVIVAVGRFGLEKEVYLLGGLLAAFVGAARESVNRVLQDWRRSGLIDLGRARVTVRASHRLVALGARTQT